MKRSFTYALSLLTIILLSFSNPLKISAQTNVNIPGDFQSELGCPGDWQPECKDTGMTKGDDGLWHSGPWNITAGDYEVKVALDGSWTTNYGAEGKQDGDNYKFTAAADGTVDFAYDEATHLLTITVN